jgi:ATPase subunit of ABC transporter with duplicated ATPase domains
MLIINELAMAYGPKLLFADVNLNLVAGNRYALVGANGAGKSTFLRNLTGAEEPNLGEIKIPKSSRIGWLRQDHYLYEQTSIINTAIAGKKELWAAMCEKEELLKKEICDEETGYRLGELEQVIIDHDGYNADIIAAELLIGLGIKEEYHYQPLSVLSGGYKLRVLLAQSLFDNPDILLLDEPTNHLDMDSIYWLESYLQENFKGVLVFISHDVAFINNVATHVLDIDYGEVRQYTGNYNKFVEQKQQIIDQKMQELNFAEKKISSMKAIVDKFRAGTRARQSKSLEKQMDKIELPDIQKTSRVAPYLNFKQKRPSGKVVLKVNDISKNFGEKKVLNKVSFTLMRGEKIIIIGPNGIGKSTLLKLLLGQLTPDEGNFEWGFETQVSYFAQDHHEALHEDITAYDWLLKQVDNVPTSIIRAVMGQVLFRQNEAYKLLTNLSGGEAARLLMAKMILEESNCLFLDEPTNHLDIEAKTALKDALKKHPGTLVMVTHDRDFASEIATRIIAITEKKITDYKGTYSEYLAKLGKDYYKRAN